MNPMSQTATSLHLQFCWEEDEDGEEGSLSYHSPHVPRRGDTVTMVWKDDSDKPELTSFDATIELVNWEFNERSGPYPTIWLRDLSKKRKWTPT